MHSRRTLLHAEVPQDSRNSHVIHNIVLGALHMTRVPIRTLRQHNCFHKEPTSCHVHTNKVRMLRSHHNRRNKSSNRSRRQRRRLRRNSTTFATHRALHSNTGARFSTYYSTRYGPSLSSRLIISAGVRRFQHNMRTNFTLVRIIIPNSTRRRTSRKRVHIHARHRHTQCHFTQVRSINHNTY